MALYSYIVARDYGFAPNPFYGVCTLATCKPKIRRCAQVGDWVVGTGSKQLGLDGHLVYAMKVAEALTYDQYWSDPRFIQKRPNLRGSLKQAFGDNIYHRDPKTGEWIQADSHHSHADGSPNQANMCHDAQSENVLVGVEFAYWGEDAIRIPGRFRHEGADICCKVQGHKCIFPEAFVDEFIKWIQSLNAHGYLGRPAMFGGKARS
jgi:hypothetical protein